MIKATRRGFLKLGAGASISGALGFGGSIIILVTDLIKSVFKEKPLVYKYEPQAKPDAARVKRK